MSHRFASLDSLVAVAALVLSGCGGSTTGPNPTVDGTFTAKIDGADWSAAIPIATGAAGGIFTIIGSTLSNPATALSITVVNVAGPGTYPLGVTGSVVGGIGIVNLGAQSWSTPLSGVAGSITFTTVSATRLVGTFSFVAAGAIGGAAGNRTVTQGVFDLPVQANGSIAVPPNAGSTWAGTVAGAPWNAAVVVMVAAPPSGTISVGASNLTHSINLILSGFTGAGSYTLGTGVARYITVTSTPANRTWGGSNTLASGTVTITSVTASRVVGSYNVTLQPGLANPGTGTLALAGAFDVGIP